MFCIKYGNKICKINTIRKVIDNAGKIGKTKQNFHELWIKLEHHDMTKIKY